MSVVTYINFNEDVGRINSSMTAGAKAPPPFKDNNEEQIAITGRLPISAFTHYIVNKKPVEKQPLTLQISNYQITANGQDEVVITGIPAGVSVTYKGDTQEVVDGKVEFSTDMPGTYRLVFTAVEYLDKEVVIEAVPAN